MGGVDEPGLPTLYEWAGGLVALRRMIDCFYDRVEADEALSGFFPGGVSEHHRAHVADWWAEALGWEVEPQDESFITRMVQAGAASEADTMRHRGALVWTLGAAITAPDPGRPRVLFQRVPEEKTVKNRLHLDLYANDQAAAVAALVARGATRADVGQSPDAGWVVLHDPEGNEFCLLEPR